MPTDNGIDASAWRAAADRLRGDPGADITIAIDVPEPPIVAPAARGPVVHARKIEEPPEPEAEAEPPEAA